MKLILELSTTVSIKPVSRNFSSTQSPLCFAGKAEGPRDFHKRLSGNFVLATCCCIARSSGRLRKETEDFLYILIQFQQENQWDSPETHPDDTGDGVGSKCKSCRKFFFLHYHMDPFCACWKKLGKENSHLQLINFKVLPRKCNVIFLSNDLG